MPSKRRAGKAVGKYGAKYGAKVGRRVAPHAARNAWRLSKAEAKLIQKALSSREPRKVRYLKYAFFAAAGIGIGVLLRRSGGSADGHQTWGSGNYQSPGGANRAGAERGYSAPSGGPLIGESHGTGAGSVPEQQEDVEQRLRTALGEDDRTRNAPRINVEVNDGVAELRGSVASTETKLAAEEIAQNTEGVQEVKNLLTVG
ncbi:MAG: BON domain-containing protein [Rubrobacteraceae bacterium]